MADNLPLTAAIRVATALAHGWRLAPLVFLAILCVALTPLAMQISLPAYFAPRGYETALVNLLALPLAIAAVFALDEPVASLWQTSGRPVRLIAAARVAIPVGATALGVFLLGRGEVVVFAVGAASLFAEALFVRRFAGTTLAWMLPTFHVAAASVVGVVEDDPAVWAWPIAQTLTPEQAVAGLAVAAVCGAGAWRPRLRD